MLKVDVRHPAALPGVHAFAEFHGYVNLSDRDFTAAGLPTEIRVGDVRKMVESKPQPANPWYRGLPMDISVDETEQFATTSFHFNSAQRNWNYTGCSDEILLHVMRILVFKQVGVNMQVIISFSHFDMSCS